MLVLLAFLFALVALFYASIGFGGGSSYIALLVLWQLPYSVIPTIALLCNIVVVSGNSINYVRAGYFLPRLLLPLVVTSLPFAYLGGRLPLSKSVFIFLLFITLLASGLRLLVEHRGYGQGSYRYRLPHLAISLALGAVLGFIAGITGIGGGIFLAPLLYNLRAAAPPQIATTASLFILLNSLAGLAGQLQKSGFDNALGDYWLLPLMALMGGQIGNQMMLRWFSPRTAALLTAILVLFVAINLGLSNWRLWV